MITSLFATCRLLWMACLHMKLEYVVKLGKRWGPKTLWFYSHKKHASKSHLPALLLGTVWGYVCNNKKEAGHSNGALYPDSILGLLRSARISTVISAPPLQVTAHPEPLPFSELAETRSRQIIRISMRVLGWSSPYFSPNYYTAPVPSFRTWSRSSDCVFDISGQWWPEAYMNADI